MSKNKKEEYINKIFVTKQGYNITIIGYRNNSDIDIKFDDGFQINNCHLSAVKKGLIRNPYHPSVYGIGFVGIGPYESSVDGKSNKPYLVWQSMFRRCHCPIYQSKYPTYKGCHVAEEWNNFQVFAEWFHENYKEGLYIDKDLLFKGNKLYSKDTCCFVPECINNLLVKCDGVRGKYPVGINKEGGKYKARVWLNGIRKALGYFDNIEEAFNYYKNAKENFIKEIADKYKNVITEQCYVALIKYAVEIND